MCVQHVGLRREGDGLSREPLALLELAALREQLAAQLVPQDLWVALLARGGRQATFEPLLGLVFASEGEKRLG